MAIVKTSNPEWFGVKKTIFAAGEICPDKNTGEFEIPDESVEDVLADYGDHISLVGEDGSAKKPEAPKEQVKDIVKDKDKEEGEEEEKIKEKSESDDLNKEEEEAITGKKEEVNVTGANTGSGTEEGKNEEAPAVDEEQKKAMIASLDEKSKADLSKLCQEAGFPGGEWRGLNKGELIEYLKGKLA